MKTQNPSRCSLEPHFKWISKFRLEDYFILRLMKTPCYFALDDCAEKTTENVNHLSLKWIVLPASSAIKVAVIRQVRMYCSLSVKINMCKTLHGALKIMDTFCLRLFLRVWLVKIWISPIWTPWLMTPLHRVIYEVWDLPCISKNYQYCFEKYKNPESNCLRHSKMALTF